VSGNAASCVPNPAYYVGKETALSTNTTLATGYLYAMQVTFMAKTRVLELGVVGRTNNGAFVTMALYADNAGAPGGLLGTGTEKQMGPGQIGSAPVSALIEPAGKYWVVATFSANATSYEAAGGSYFYHSGAYATFPATFPAVTVMANQVSNQENFYLKLQDQP
jgi:hypothetical protein